MGGLHVIRWDIYLAAVPFEDLPESKIRPVLILDNSAILIDCLKMTGQPPRTGEYVLKRWKEAGLHKPTTVRLSKRLVLAPASFIKRIGSLDLIDIIEIEKRLTL